MKPMWFKVQNHSLDSQEIWVRGLEVLLSEMYWQMHFGSSKDHNYTVVFPPNFFSA